jgi:uncharacterized protein YneF (UPF0154 family)
MPVVLLLVVIVVILLGGAGLVLGALWTLFVLLWAALPWVAGIAVLMFIAALLKGSSGHTFLSGKPDRQMRDRTRREPRVRPHVVTDEARAAMAEQQRLNAEYREKIAAAKKARGE